MESGRFLLAILLMIAVVVVTNIIFPPTRSPVPGTTADTAAPAAPDTPAEAAADPSRLPLPPAQAITPVAADTIHVTSPLFQWAIATNGGGIVSAKLTQYQAFDPMRKGQPVELVPPSGTPLVGLSVAVGDRVIDLRQFPFTAEPSSDLELSEGERGELRLLHHDSASGFGVELNYTFDADRYTIDVRGRVSGTSAAPQARLELGPRLGLNEADQREDERAAAWVINNQRTGIQSVPLMRFREPRVENGPLTWVALKSKYFLVAAMQADTTAPFGGLVATPGGREEIAAHLTATVFTNARGEFAYRLYLGPQEFERLASFDNQLQDVSVFGWRFLQPVLRPLGHAISWALLQLHRALGLSYGWVLIIFGFLVRFLLWPLNAKAMRSQLKNMELQPRMKEIQARYKNDPQRLQQEMLRLYKEEGFNPMGGCLPMLLPLPVLITLFFVFQGTIEFRGVPFLWLPDLSLKDPLYILPILLGLSMFIQQWLNMRSTKDAPPQMKYMTYFMPVFLTILFLNFASGLNLYYMAMNIASVPQQLQIMKERQRRMKAA